MIQLKFRLVSNLGKVALIIVDYDRAFPDDCVFICIYIRIYIYIYTEQLTSQGRKVTSNPEIVIHQEVTGIHLSFLGVAIYIYIIRYTVFLDSWDRQDHSFFRGHCTRRSVWIPHEISLTLIFDPKPIPTIMSNHNFKKQSKWVCLNIGMNTTKGPAFGISMMIHQWNIIYIYIMYIYIYIM